MRLLGRIAHPMLYTALLLAACGLTAALAVGEEPRSEPSESPRPDSPVSPEDSLQYFRLPPGLRIELVACEPEVIDPIALRFDEQGRMWVVEMRDYPHGPAEGEPPRSQIRVLEDRTGDGRFETSQVFADELLFPTGLQPWRGGVIVTLAGQVAYMQDTSGDGRADRVETWFTGFAEENPQLRANRPRLGLDNHIYIANGLRGGTVVDVRQGKGPEQSLRGMDFRFHPLTDRHEAVTGMAQFGLTFDDFGNRFVCSNRNPLKHIVLEDRYIRRNPALAVPAAAHDVAAAGDQSRVFPISRFWTTSNLHAGQFTAACAAEIYRGDLLPEPFYGNAFTCEPTGNLVHREVLSPAGATFHSRPGREGVEFLASYDEWFQPVYLELGPDGALYVVDMHRAVIEHPQYMPEELRRRPDLRDGDDRGRIYRIVPAQGAPPTEPPRLAEQPAAELVKLLEHPSAWWRETAARLLLERQDRSVQSALQRLAGKAQRPAARVAALWALEGLELLSPELVRQTLDDPHARVREQAVVLGERWLEDSPELRRHLVRLAGDSDPRVRFQVALSLAPIAGAEEVDALREIATRGADDVWTRRAVGLASGPHATELAVSLLEQPAGAESPGSENHLALVNELIALVGSENNPRHWLRLLEALTELPDDAPSQRVQLVGLKHLLQATARHTSLAALLDRSDDDDLKQAVARIFTRAALAADEDQVDNNRRVEAIELLAFHPDSIQILTRLALEETVQPVRLQAIAALARHAELEPWQRLLDGFAGQSPAIRRQILDAVIGQAPRAALLVEKLADGQIRSPELDRSHIDRLVKHRDAQIREAAQRVLAHAVPEDRQQVLADYQQVLQLEAQPERGREVFRQNCATCHRVEDQGVNVGPDISDTRTKTPQQLLADILQPNRAIDSNYLSYSVVTEDGRVLTGLLTSETASSITLTQPEGKTLTLLRDQIEQLQSNGVSLMPDGLEKNIPPQAMADLLAFLKNWRYLDGRTPLGPED